MIAMDGGHSQYRRYCTYLPSERSIRRFLKVFARASKLDADNDVSKSVHYVIPETYGRIVSPAATRDSLLLLRSKYLTL